MIIAQTTEVVKELSKASETWAQWGPHWYLIILLIVFFIVILVFIGWMAMYLGKLGLRMLFSDEENPKTGEPKGVAHRAFNRFSRHLDVVDTKMGSLEAMAAQDAVDAKGTNTRLDKVELTVGQIDSKLTELKGLVGKETHIFEIKSQLSHLARELGVKPPNPTDPRYS